MAKSIGIGLAGASGAFGHFIAEAIEEMGGARVVAVAGSNAERTEQARLHLRADHGYTDFGQLVSDESVDLVIVATPPGLHAQMGITTALAGKALFIEKPVALTSREGLALLRAVTAAGIPSSVDFVMRYNTIFETLKTWIATGLLGELHYVDFRNNAADEFLPPAHWFWDRSQSGGIFVEHGVHFFDIYGSLIGAAPTVVQGLRTKRPHTDQEDRLIANVLYQNGSIATYYHSFDKPSRMERTAAVLGFDRGYVTVTGWIATGLTVDAIVDEHQFEQLSATEHMRIAQVEALTGAQQNTRGNGRDYLVTRQVQGSLQLPRAKSDVYRTSVADALRDVVASMQDNNHVQRVTLADGVRALAIACAAESARDSEEMTETWREIELIHST